MNYIKLAKLFYKYNIIEKLLPCFMVVKYHSLARKYFLASFLKNTPQFKFTPNKNYHKKLWNLTFQLPLMNSAGMFKSGEGYDLVSAIGAGAYVGGTSTYLPRLGNYKLKIKHPVLMLAKSHSAINFLGLPNLGDEILAKKIITKHKSNQCPIGWSITRSPEIDEQQSLDNLIKSLWLYHNNTQIDFIELNESCPNILTNLNKENSNLANRLQYIAKHFLKKRERNLPVIVKFSNDLAINNLLNILEPLLIYQFDGVILGNTSTNYLKIRPNIAISEQKLFDYFTNNFGGGVSGQVLKEQSLALCSYAVSIIKKLKPNHEFHVIRSGGIDSWDDIIQSNNAGIALNQWYTGFFNNYLQFENNIYKNFLLKN